MQYGFFSAGGGTCYIRAVQRLTEGDRIWVNVPRAGYVGVGRVTGGALPATGFKVTTALGGVPVLAAATRGHYCQNYVLERCEYFVPVRWLETVSVEHAFAEKGLFGNRNTVCHPASPNWSSTIRRLKKRFPDYDKQ